MDSGVDLGAKSAESFCNDEKFQSVSNSHFASDFHEEVPEVGGGGGEDHLVRREGSATAARQSHVRQVLAAEHISRQSAKSEIVQGMFILIYM